MRSLAFVGATLALLLVATPVSAHHKPGHAGGPPHGNPGKQGGPPGQRGEAGPESGPGNSGAAHWCKDNFADQRGDPFPFKNRGQCVSYFARGGTLDTDDDENADRSGDLEITEVLIRDNGTFRLRGAGADDLVIVSIGGGSGKVVGFGEGKPGSGGSWEVEGEWACQDTSSDEAARFRVHDSDERDRLLTTFPCDELDD